MYPLAGWGVPLLLTIVVASIDLSSSSQQQHLFKPNFGLSACWLHGHTAKLLYFYGPLGGLLVINTALFIWTSYSLHRAPLTHDKHLWRRHSKNQGINDTRQRLKLHFKLFTIMGLSWVFELLSWAWPSEACWPWYVPTDLLNALQGVWIFMIFVLKEDVLRKLWKIISAAVQHLYRH